MANDILANAKKQKNDEFYTLYEDIQKEMNFYVEYNPDVFRGKTILLPCDDPEWSNFTRYFAEHFEEFGIKKLISTSYARDSKQYKAGTQVSLWELESGKYDEEKTYSHGKIFTLTRDKNQSGRIDIDDLDFEYLEGDGDFRSDEVKWLRNEADIIITNPPFSIWREFFAWIIEAEKQFAIIGNMNAITYKEIFPLIKDNKVWIDNPFVRGAGYFTSPLELNTNLSYFNSHDYREGFIRVPGVRWFTNIELGRRHTPLTLMSVADNKKFSKHKEIKGVGYLKYDNYDAIEVPFSDAVPSDYLGAMGVPISFMDKHCPEQFEILGITSGREEFDKRAWPTKRYINAIQHSLKNDKTTSGSKVNTGAELLFKDLDELKSFTKKDTYYTADGVTGVLYRCYDRLIIRFSDSWVSSHPNIFKKEC